MARLVLLLEWMRLRHGDQPPAGGALVAAIGDQRHIAQTGIKRHGCMQHMRHESGAPESCCHRKNAA